MITEKQVEAALDWLDDNAIPRAQARSDRLALEAYAASLEALLMKEFDNGDTSAVIQKRDARCHQSFLKHLQATKEATFIDEKYRYLAEAKINRIAVFQTQSANRRHLP